MSIAILSNYLSNCNTSLLLLVVPEYQLWYRNTDCFSIFDVTTVQMPNRNLAVQLPHNLAFTDLGNFRHAPFRFTLRFLDDRQSSRSYLPANSSSSFLVSTISPCQQRRLRLVKGIINGRYPYFQLGYFSNSEMQVSCLFSYLFSKVFYHTTCITVDSANKLTRG